MENQTQPTLALRYVALAVLVAFAIGAVVGVVAHSKYAPCVIVPTISVQHDTITKRDTIHGKVIAPVIHTVIRRDTLKLPSKLDTAHSDTSAYVTPGGALSVPITRQVYVSEDYRAVVSGWHATLDSITLYPKVKYITTTVTKLAPPLRQNWALVVGPSVGYGTTKAPIFGASVVLGFTIRTWH